MIGATPIEEIVAAYRSTGSIWKTAKHLNLCGQSVWERLRAIGYPMQRRRWTRDEIAELCALIGNSTLTEVAQRLGRPYAAVACMASRLGIVTRFGNRVKRKIPRGAGLTKDAIAILARDLQAWPGSIRQFARSRGFSIDTLALAIQTHAPRVWDERAQATGLLTQVCAYCGVQFYPMSKRQTTCSRRCTAHKRVDQTYFGGKRRMAIGMAEGICQLCLQPRKVLSAHHLIGKQNDPDNELLVALCQGCHKCVEMLAARKLVDDEEGWQRLMELVVIKRLADRKAPYVGVHVCADIEYLTAEDYAEIMESEEAVPAPMPLF